MVSTPDELRFDGQVAVISGAGGGLGRQYALLLAARGARVVVNDIGGSVTGDGSDGAAADSVADEIIALGGEAVADGHSVTTPDGGEAIVDAAIGAWGRVDILINNAGIVATPRRGHHRRAARSPRGRAPQGGIQPDPPGVEGDAPTGLRPILNTCSAAGLLGAERMSNYGAAKTGLVGLTRVLAAEGAERNIKVNAIAPIAYTRMLQHSVDTAPVQNDDAAQAILDELAGQYLQRLDPALVAPVAAFLTHRECPVSGEIYTVGAGHVARFFIGRTKGFYSPGLSVEDVRDHLAEIRDEAGYTVPGGPADEIADLFATIIAPAEGPPPGPDPGPGRAGSTPD